MIQLQNITKAFRSNRARKTILDNVSVTLDSTRSYGLMGPNGCGKSTLLRLIAGIDVPNRGRVIRKAEVSWPLGFSGGFHPAMTGRENIVFVARAYGVKIDEVLEFVEDFAELGAYIDAPVRTYSTGMQSRLAFGLSMAIEFDCYLVDEITAVGDARFQARCIHAFAERRKRSGIILASHSVTTLIDFCESGIVVYNQDLILFAQIEEAIEFYRKHY